MSDNNLPPNPEMEKWINRSKMKAGTKYKSQETHGNPEAKVPTDFKTDDFKIPEMAKGEMTDGMYSHFLKQQAELENNGKNQADFGYLSLFLT